MTALFRVFLSVSSLVLSLAPLQAADPPPLPSHATRARLLSYESKVLETHIVIGVVVRGESDLSKQFKTDHAIHVTFIWPVSDKGSRVRKTDTRVFMWNEPYGWFTSMVGYRRGTAVIDICSEKLGMVEIK
ncbi:MAG: hypothetical protein VCA37_03570 [Roseibacillus sp.]